MKPSKQLIDDIYRQRVLRARNMPAEEKLLGHGTRPVLDEIRPSIPPI